MYSFVLSIHYRLTKKRNYRLHKGNESAKMSSDFINWYKNRNPRDKNVKTFPTEDETKAYFKNWLITYTHLKNFLEVNDRYPYNSEKGTEEESLKKWVGKQKHAYNNQGSKNVMTENRIRKLMELPQWNFEVHAMYRRRSK